MPTVVCEFWYGQPFNSIALGSNRGQAISNIYSQPKACFHKFLKLETTISGFIGC